MSMPQSEAETVLAERLGWNYARIFEFWDKMSIIFGCFRTFWTLKREEKVTSQATFVSLYALRCCSLGEPSCCVGSFLKWNRPAPILYSAYGHRLQLWRCPWCYKDLRCWLMLPLYRLSSECVVLPLDMDVLWACRHRFEKNDCAWRYWGIDCYLGWLWLDHGHDRSSIELGIPKALRVFSFETLYKYPQRDRTQSTST